MTDLGDGVLVIGYGNTLRTDDGLGWYAAERLASDPRLEGATVIGRHQLTPELALDVGRADLVVFVDASHGPAPGTIAIDSVAPAGHSAAAWSHQLTPSTLVALARELYGRAPEVILVRVGVASLDHGDQLSPALEAAMPAIVDAVATLVAERAGSVPVVGQPHA